MDQAFAAWVDEARARPIEDEARARSAGLRRVGGELIGPCPACGGRDRFSVNPRKGIFFCRASGRAGDVIALVEYLDASDFIAACATLTGRPPPPGSGPGGGSSGFIDRDELQRREEARAAAAAANAREAIDWRERERRKAYEIWRQGVPVTPGSPVGLYLAGRGLDLPKGAPLRAAVLDYWHQPPGAGRPAIIHSGPAMLAAITDDAGRFAGLHQTWIDPLRPGAKETIADPETGEILPAKKIRGSKRRAAIKLVMPGERLVIGEGIETVASALVAERAKRPDTYAVTAYWSAVDLGHLAGKAVATVPHPTLIKIDSRGFKRVARVPGPEPEAQPERDLMPPEAVTEIVILGDGDSDRFTTQQALARAANRWQRPNRTIRVAWAPDGRDWNDVLREGE